MDLPGPHAARDQRKVVLRGGTYFTSEELDLTATLSVNASAVNAIKASLILKTACPCSHELTPPWKHVGNVAAPLYCPRPVERPPSGRCDPLALPRATRSAASETIYEIRISAGEFSFASFACA